MGIIRDPDIAADITQDVFIKVYTSITGYRHEGFKTWISKIATNSSVDYIRKRTKEQQKIVSLDFHQQSITTSDTPESLFLQKKQKEKLLFICDDLGTKYKDIVKKYYIENKSYKVIAYEENISIRTVESRLYRAKKIIKKQWEEEGYDTFS